MYNDIKWIEIDRTETPIYLDKCNIDSVTEIGRYRIFSITKTIKNGGKKIRFDNEYLNIKTNCLSEIIKKIDKYESERIAQ